MMRESNINWYPGHMAKARRLLEEQMKRADLIIEVCDARLPHSSRNPDLDRMIKKKKHILLLNKADLADENATQGWLARFREDGITAAAVNGKSTPRNRLTAMIEKETEDVVTAAETRGIRTTVRAMVIGVPNVGKSTLINRIRGSALAKTGDRPGVTQNIHWIKINPYLELMDSPGLLWPRLDDQKAARRLCYIGTIKDEVVDMEELTLHLLNDLAETNPGSLEERFHVSGVASLRGLPLLDAVCRGRGWLLKGNECDYERASRIVPDEFRSGMMGRITLEIPERMERSKDDQPGGAGKKPGGV